MDKELLKKNYKDACNAYLRALADAWGWDLESYGFWIADCVGETYSYGDCTFIDMEDIIFCVENDIKQNEYMEWQDYCLFANEFNQNIPNLKAWHNGCPRLSKDAQKHLKSMKERFEKIINEYKDNTIQAY